MSRFNSYINKSNAPRSIHTQGPNTVLNNTGGYVYAITPMKQLRRFLLLGVQDSYYKSGHANFSELKNLVSVLMQDTTLRYKALDMITEVYDNSDFTDLQSVMYIVSAFLSAGDEFVNNYVYKEFIPKIRNLSHLMLLISLTLKQRSLGSGFRRAIERYFISHVSEYDVLKYGSRWGISLKDLIFKAHPSLTADMFNIIMGNKDDIVSDFAIAVDRCMNPNSPRSLVNELVSAYDLPIEMIHHSFVDKAMFERLLLHMNFHTVLWNLGKMSQAGVFNKDQNVNHVRNILLKGARHMNVFDYIKARSAYNRGRGYNRNWNVDSEIIDALDDGFVHACENLSQNYHYTGNVTFVVDLSGSMSQDSLRFKETCGTMAGIITYTMMPLFDSYRVIGYGGSAKALPIVQGMKMSEVIEACRPNMGWTDISSVAEYMNRHNIDTDTMVIITDNEINSGTDIEDHVKAWERKYGHPIKVIVMAMSATGFSVVPADDNRVNLPAFDSFKAFDNAMRL